MARTWFETCGDAGFFEGPDWSGCESLIEAFEAALRRGETPTIQDYLRVDGPERRALLLELIHVELEFRLRAGQSARVEVYFERHFDQVGDRRAVLELIASEFRLRQRFQGKVELDEYRTRFPQHFDELLLRLESDIDHDDADADARIKPQGNNWPLVPGFELTAELGRGGMGVVFKARELGLGRDVALKFLPTEYANDSDRLDRFLREARTASALNHPNICTVHALSTCDGLPYIVMEHIDGMTLKEVANRSPALDEIVRAIGQAARALAAAHHVGVVHRDIKPENIMVRKDGYVKVLDFGLARRLPSLAQPHHAAEQATEAGKLLGTMGYMSPEQTQGASAEPASDIFSLGIVLYELATGTNPFKADSAIGTLYAIATRQPVAPSKLNLKVSHRLEALIEAMLHKDPVRRPTASDVEAALSTLGRTRVQVAAKPPSRRAIVHRERELAILRSAQSDADLGQGWFVCVVGEPGIGKTTLVEDFLAEAATERGCLVARGHCFERLAGTEAYLPVIDALRNLLVADERGSMARMMTHLAPSWYAQVDPPGAVGGNGTTPSPEKLDSSSRIPSPESPTPALSQHALLREFGNFLQEVSRLKSVILFFDDIHWADVSTVDLLAYLGRQCRAMPVVIIVTYRPTEMLLGPHPFHRVKLELLGKGVCTELSLGFLDREDINRYLALAFPNHAFPRDFSDLIHFRTEGSPLFMVDLLSYLRERGVIVEIDGHWTLEHWEPSLWQELPKSVRSMIERKLGQLQEADRRLLAAASVQGQEFDSAVVAGALGLDVADVEERLQVLDDVHGLVGLVREYEFPDRALTLRYVFVHISYQQALYDDCAPSRRAAVSVALARTLQGHHPEETPAVASELACLYEVGRDYAQAAHYYRLAALNAARVFAHQEAVSLARRGLSLLEKLPEDQTRVTLELPLQMTLGLQLQMTEGFAASEVKDAYTRAKELSSRIQDESSSFPVLWGLWLFHKVRSELHRARDMTEELMALARKKEDPALLLQVHQAFTVTSLCRGEPVLARQHMMQGAALYDPCRHGTHSFQFGQDPGVACKAIGAVALWLLGYPDQALRQSEEAIRLSDELSQPSSQTLALHFAAMLHQCLRDGSRTRLYAERCGEIAAEHGFSFWQAGSAIMTGWALSACGNADQGIFRMRRGLLDWQTTDSLTYLTYYQGLLAEALDRRGEVDEPIRLLDQALELAQWTGEGLYEAELYRLRGEVRLRLAAESDAATFRLAEEDFHRAIDVSTKQEAKSLTLRAAMSLVRLEQRLSTSTDAKRRLAEVYRGFSEGLTTADLVEAQRLFETVA